MGLMVPTQICETQPSIAVLIVAGTAFRFPNATYAIVPGTGCSRSCLDLFEPFRGEIDTQAVEKR